MLVNMPYMENWGYDTAHGWTLKGGVVRTLSFIPF